MGQRAVEEDRPTGSRGLLGKKRLLQAIGAEVLFLAPASPMVWTRQAVPVTVSSTVLSRFLSPKWSSLLQALLHCLPL